MNYIKKYVKAIIFDMDGTIVKTDHLWQKATADLFQQKGIVLDQPLLKSFRGVDVYSSLKIIKEKFNLSESVETILKQKHELLLKTIKTDGIKFIEGFKAFCQTLNDHNMPCSIATNSDDIWLGIISNQMKLKDLFQENIYNITHVANKAKPDPALFLYAAKQLNAKPSECLVFEDSLPGFIAAQKAGMKCIAIKNLSNTKHLHLTHNAIDNYHEAIEKIKELI